MKKKTKIVMMILAGIGILALIVFFLFIAWAAKVAR